MIWKLVGVVVPVLVGVTVAWWLQRSRPQVPTRAAWHVPDRVRRRDFDGAEREWLVAVFTSGTCDTCAKVAAALEPLASPAVAVHVVEISEQPELHRRYGVEAVPMVLMADAAGEVRRSFLGPTPATEMWAAMAELREPPMGLDVPG